MPNKLPYEIQEIAELSGHDDRVWTVAWNPTRPFLATCSSDKTVRIYHYSASSSPTKPLRLQLESSIATGHAKTVRSVAWAPSGRTLATASFDANIGIWEQEPETDQEHGGGGDSEEGGGDAAKGDWECMSLLEGHETECKCVAYSSTGTLLASCSRDKTVWVWEVQPDADFECMGVLMSHTQDVKFVAWHPTEELLASASYDDTIKLYADDPSDDWDVVATLTGHTSTVWALAFSPCGRFLASASDDLTVRIWAHMNTTSGGESKSIGNPYRWECVSILREHDRSVYSVSWGKGKNDGFNGTSAGWLASAGGDGRIVVWDMQVGADGIPSPGLISARPDSHGVSDVNCVSWCPREGLEDLLATAGDDCLARIWKVTQT